MNSRASSNVKVRRRRQFDRCHRLPAARILVAFFALHGFTTISSLAGVHTDDHALVHLGARLHEHLHTLADVEQRIRRCRLLPPAAIATPLARCGISPYVIVKWSQTACTIVPSPLRIVDKLASVAQQPSGRHQVFEVR